MKRQVFEILHRQFRIDYTFLPEFLRIIPAIVFYIHYHLDLTLFNHFFVKLKNKKKIKYIKDDSKYILFEDAFTHQSLVKFYKNINGAQIILLDDPGVLRYRSEFLEFILYHNFKNSDVIHICTLENLAYCKESILKKFKKLPQRKIATAHLYVPDSEIAFLSKYFDEIICFDVRQYNHLKSIGVRNVKPIPHPAHTSHIRGLSKNDVRQKFNIPDKRIVLSLAGYIRKDKGLDFLRKCFLMLEEKYLNQIFLNVSGMGVFVNKRAIIESFTSINIGIRIEITDKPLDEKELVENIILADYFLLPYSRNTKNISGVLIEAAYHDTTVIGSDYSPLGEMINEYSLGLTYKNDDCNSFVNLIKDLIDGKIEKPAQNPEFKIIYDNNKILKQYELLYKSGEIE